MTNCEYCEHGSFNAYMHDRNGREDAAYINSYNMFSVRIYVDDDKYLTTIPIKHCPMCGRRLGDTDER